ncbi:MAG: CapA family protein [Bacteroidales bacterium]|nr:CapA family protein [Bacteroidales bacterium]MCF8391022.1 CapA family protein [Bacteroidales bacterium]
MQKVFLPVSLSIYFLFLGFSLQAKENGIPPIPDSTIQISRFHAEMMSRDKVAHNPLQQILDSTIIIADQIHLAHVTQRSIRIVAVGDVMPGTNYPSESYLPRSCSALFQPVKEIISKADVAIANLEGVFSSNGGTPKNCKDPKTCYVFRMPDEYASCIMDAGFDILGVANNHVNDFGLQGRKNTAALLDKLDIPFAGFADRTTVIYESNGLKIGFCAFAPHTGTVNMKDYEGAARLVSELKSKTDIVIVSFHGGAEGKDHQNLVKGDETFLGHNRGNTYLFAHKVVDAGADLVVGSGPHVVRAIEMYKGKLIAYSLGNFCTYQRFNLSGPNANAPLLEVELDENGKLLSSRIYSFLQLGEGGPVEDPENRAAKRIMELSRQDFPDQNLRINSGGQIEW